MTSHLVNLGLVQGMGTERWRTPEFLTAFGNASAAANALSSFGMVDARVSEAMRAFSATTIPDYLGMRDYRSVLDAAGFVLPRWLRFRPATKQDLAEQQRARIAKHRPPRHLVRAKTLVHQQESYLQEAIDTAMTDAYGEDWPEERLPLCGKEGRQLLTRWRQRGGAVLSHADYPHYAAIMTEPDHFGRIFGIGFSVAATLDELIGKAKALRAASHHPGHEFTKENLRDLRSVWRAITKGLKALEADYGIIWER